mmetsp:Transcript_8323/g.13918  ORF Transcript_8323/g.13918 Transcript_8323/m.13918 type:complete len:288 (-) Transcript_8323:43-906(-)
MGLIKKPINRKPYKPKKNEDWWDEFLDRTEYEIQEEEEELQEGASEFFEDLPSYDTNDLKKAKTLWDYIVYFKYIVNLVLVAIPYLCLSFAGVVFNFYANIALNKGYAGGNLLLIFNSAFLIYQTIISNLLVFELPSYLRRHKPERASSFVLAAAYNVVYLIGALKLYSMIYWEDNLEDDTSTAVTFMILGYFAVMNGPNFGVNLAIILKELSLESFQLITKHVGAYTENYALGEGDALKACSRVFWVFNPLAWIDLLWDSIFGYDVEDYVIENPKDEQHYYKNWKK